jgi:integrase
VIAARARTAHAAPGAVDQVLCKHVQQYGYSGDGLERALEESREWDVIECVPCTIRLVRTPKPSMGFYDFDEYERLLEAAKELRPTAHLVTLLGGEAGLRCGEMIGLEWSDVDLVKRQMCIQRSEWRGYVTVPKGGRLPYVPLTARLASALREHRHLKSPRVLGLDDGSPLTQDVVGEYVRKAGGKAGVPARVDRTRSRSLKPKASAA